MTRKWPVPTVEEPDTDEIISMSNDSECEATDGCLVEPDGICPHGYPSWLLYLGYISKNVGLEST